MLECTDFFYNFVYDLKNVHEEHSQTISSSIPKLPFDSLLRLLPNSTRCFLYIDHDGTLVNLSLIVSTKNLVHSKHDYINLLTRLCRDRRNIVYLMSICHRADLQDLT